MEFNMPNNNKTNIIKVIGVGGGGSNAVNHMYELGIKDVDFIVCNTDSQALEVSSVPTKIQLGVTLTGGRGAGSIPDVGRNAAIENIDEIKEYLSDNTNMVFITAGMGGGTGTGAGPVVAKIAKDMGILTVGIVTVPFSFEGKRRKEQAEAGIKEMRDSVDTLLIINNEKLRDMYGNLTIRNAYAQADQVLASAAKGIAEVISKIGFINVDLNDVNTVMKDSGVAIMGTASAEGENRAIEAAEQALSSPLLNDNDINGAKQVLLNITFGDVELTMDEMSEITDFIVDAAGGSAEMIMGQGYDETLGDKVCVTVIATGFQSNSTVDTGVTPEEPKKKYLDLGTDETTMISKPITSPTQSFETKVEPTLDNEAVMPYLKSETVQEIQEPLNDLDEELNMESIMKEEQATFNFENTQPLELKKETPKPLPVVMEELKKEEKIIHYLEDDLEEESPVNEIAKTPETTTVERVSKEEQQQINEGRRERIQELSMKLRTPFGLSELENEPAYIRRKIKLEDTPHSSESEVSRFTLSEEEGQDGKTSGSIKSNNSFLHDNVD
ncbi:MAG: cell division protein FtsZ [Urechidicola sp.]|jgi:cell division protein FtsZ|tara:strand:+ start:13553 stop:15217 length:1665 start_codon:yes stop_codon:yes gene_type:complete